MRRFFSDILLILALCAALTTTAFAMAVYPNSEFGDPGFHHETDFSGDDDFVVYFDPERDEFHVYKTRWLRDSRRFHWMRRFPSLPGLLDGRH